MNEDDRDFLKLHEQLEESMDLLRCRILLGVIELIVIAGFVLAAIFRWAK